MVNYREIIRLHHMGYSQRQIIGSVGCSSHTIKSVLDTATEKGINWPLDDDVSNEELQTMLFPKLYSAQSNRVEPDYVYIHRELAKPGVTMSLLWEEYCRSCHDSGKVPYQTTHFNEKYRKWARVTKATMRIQHKPGEAMQVDWAGNTLPIYDAVNGEESALYLFVAVLPCSCFVYAEACTDMKSENWLLCHAHAYSYFGGVTRLLIPDNLKTGVISNTRYDTVLNRSYQEMAEHYGTAIVPARVRKPQDKSLAEGSVRFASTWIIAVLRNHKFFTVAEAQEAVREKLDELNNRPFQKREGSRRSAYLLEEKDFMMPLPSTAYEPAAWTVATISSDYLVSDGKNRYSVPFDLIGERVDIRLTRNTVEIFFHGNRVASHVRNAVMQRDPVVKPEHMPTEHRKYLLYNEDDFTKWALEIGEKTTEVIRYFLGNGKAPEQGFKSCASLTKLAERYGSTRLEDACARAYAYSSSPSLRNISTILKSGVSSDSSKNGVVSESPNGYGITRGADYFSKRGGGSDD